ncbi:peptidoglycan-binding protein [Streptomyces oryzae]|uniref:Peptidoglycan-binding protein n=2 Tax=Streptomyces oryzae TaxID=1434886 RepID=A0ABS3XAR4_9ACTN|nr:peptidoglycan-binding protein [Streptomyces oryzae]
MLVVAVAGAATAALTLQKDGASTDHAEETATATAPVTRGDVVETESVDGKLTYAGEQSISATANGVVTWVPSEGTTITRGKSLFKIDNKPVTLMYGSLPLYRTLKEGVKGADVKALETNLKVLGYGDALTVDKEFTSTTADAVKEWQQDVGLKETGTVDASQVVFESGPLRVSEVAVDKGGRVGVGAKALTVTGTEPTVHVDLDPAKQNTAKKGATVGVTLPDGKEVKGKITLVGKVAKAGKEKGKSTIDVDIKLSTKKSGSIDQAPVTVKLESERAKDVLSVPIEALLALREGGFGVEVVKGTRKDVVPVKTGTYGGGRVEISGSGISEGTKVGVPSS